MTEGQKPNSNWVMARDGCRNKAKIVSSGQGKTRHGGREIMNKIRQNRIVVNGGREMDWCC